jgi:hypothetical protein
MRVLIVTLLAAVSITSAWDEIRIDFGDLTPNEAPETWNQIHAGGGEITDLSNFSDGLLTGVLFKTKQTVMTSTGPTVESYWNSNIVTSNWQGNNIGWLDSSAAQKCTYGNNGNGTGLSYGPALMTFEGLNPSEAYSVEIVCMRDFNSSVNINVGGNQKVVEGVYAPLEHEVTGGVPATSSRIGIVDKAILSDWDINTAFSNSDWLIWDEVSPNSNGDLLLSFELTEGTYVFVNAIRLTPVPEPATFVLFFVGGLVARRQMAG